MPSSNLKKSNSLWNRQEFLFFWNRQKWFIIVIFAVIFGGVLLYSYLLPRYYFASCVFVWDRVDLQSENHQLPVIQTVPSPELYQELVNQSFKDSLLTRVLGQFSETEDIDVERLRKDIDNYLYFENAKPHNSVSLYMRSYRPNLAFITINETLKELDEKLGSLREKEIKKITRFLDTKKEYIMAKIKSIDKKIAFQNGRNPNQIGVNQLPYAIKIQDIKRKLADTRIERELCESNLRAYEQQLESMSTDVSDAPFEDSPILIEQRRQLDDLIDRRNRLANENTNSDDLGYLDRQIDNKKKQMIEIALDKHQSPQNHLSNVHSSTIQQLKKEILEQKLNLHVLKSRERLYQNLLNKHRSLTPEKLEYIHTIDQLQNNRSIYKQLYSSLLKQLETLNFMLEASPENLRVIHPADIPNTPIPIYRTRLLMVGIYLGLVVALGLALLRHNSKKTLKNEADVKKETGHTVLGIIPRVNSTHFNYKNVEDTFIGICMKMFLHPNNNKIRSILFSSALSGEGKSFCTVNFFINCAKLGKRVLLIDANLRNPKLDKIFDISPSPGLSDYILGYSSLQSVAKKIYKNNSRLIPAGSHTENPIGILSHPRLKELLKACEASFDLVLIDAAHILLTANDPLVLSTLVSHTIMVVLRGETDSEMVKKALHSLQQMNVNVSGIILNDIRSNNHYDVELKTSTRKQHKTHLSSKNSVGWKSDVF